MASTVIKAGQSGKKVRRLTTVDLADHLAEARAVIEEAHARAAVIVADAEQEGRRLRREHEERGRQEGREKGYVEGTEAGKREAFEEAQRKFASEQADLVASMGRVIAQYEEMKEDLRLSATRDLLELAALAATRLTYAIGALHSEAAVENLRRALSLVASKTDLTIRANPRDIAALQTFAETALQQVRKSASVRLVEDDTITPGGCVVRTEHGEVDASLEAQVAEMAAIMTGGNPDD